MSSAPRQAGDSQTETKDDTTTTIQLESTPNQPKDENISTSARSTFTGYTIFLLCSWLVIWILPSSFAPPLFVCIPILFIPVLCVLIRVARNGGVLTVPEIIRSFTEAAWYAPLALFSAYFVALILTISFDLTTVPDLTYFFFLFLLIATAAQLTHFFLIKATSVRGPLPDSQTIYYQLQQSLFHSICIGLGFAVSQSLLFLIIVILFHSSWSLAFSLAIECSVIFTPLHALTSYSIALQLGASTILMRRPPSAFSLVLLPILLHTLYFWQFYVWIHLHFTGFANVAITLVCAFLLLLSYFLYLRLHIQARLPNRYVTETRFTKLMPASHTDFQPQVDIDEVHVVFEEPPAKVDVSTTAQ